MSLARAALMGGMGYPLTETPWGMPQLKTRLEAIGVECILVSWSARQAVYDFMHGYSGKRIYCGDSLGAGSAGQYPEDVEGAVDYAAGFQPSMDDARTLHGNQQISANIIRATCIYDPRWIDTVGLGQAKWIETPNSSTKLMTIQHWGAHPNDWGWSQDLVFSQIQKVIG